MLQQRILIDLQNKPEGYDASKYALSDNQEDQRASWLIMEAPVIYGASLMGQCYFDAE